MNFMRLKNDSKKGKTTCQTKDGCRNGRSTVVALAHIAIGWPLAGEADLSVVRKSPYESIRSPANMATTGNTVF